MTKRQLGVLFIIAGIALIAALLGADAVGASRFAGIGPLQRIALGGGILVTLVGMTLLPLGNRPA